MSFGLQHREAVESTVKWGVHIDGNTGVIRTPVEKLVYLAHVTTTVIKLGVCTVLLLQSLVGSWVSVLLQRRRMLCLLDLTYECLRSRHESDVIRLSRAVKLEMLSLVLLSPLAATELRSSPSKYVYATDASSTMAAVISTQMPKTATEEFSRYTSRKGRWARLLRPGCAYLRERDLLSVESQLPDENPDPGHALWPWLLSAMPFTLESVWNTPKAEHINISELKAALEAERCHATRQPHSRPIIITDSQVVLSCLVKGRSASPSLNSCLRKHLPRLLVHGCVPYHAWVPSAANPADEPSRGKPLRPSTPVPPWLAEMLRGDYTLLDEKFPLQYQPDAPTWENMRDRDSTSDMSRFRRDLHQPVHPVFLPPGALDAEPRSMSTRLDVAACAKQSHSRIGEAARPGPREQLPETLPVTQGTDSEVMAKLSRAPALLDELLRAYVRHQYATDGRLHMVRHLLAGLQREYPYLKRALPSAWQTISTWEIMEPVVHRTPLPEPVLQAMIALSVAQKWYRTAGVLSLIFYAILRPGE
eukprot:4669063-Amphidinium_carterae.1